MVGDSFVVDQIDIQLAADSPDFAAGKSRIFFRARDFAEGSQE
jgi:hypothetical protein